MGRNIREYEVFKLSHQMTLKIYNATKSFPADERYGLTSQLRRAAYSIPMNLVEGGARSSQAEFRRFVEIARGSCAEVDYQLDLCYDLRYISENIYDELKSNNTSIGKMLNKLMKKINTSQ
ncbi:four helix bundle protein [candidate division KSB1 bacterium]|nr:four helix bundle protein [candidate division KSB1 bacterium]